MMRIFFRLFLIVMFKDKKLKNDKFGEKSQKKLYAAGFVKFYFSTYAWTQTISALIHLNASGRIKPICN